MLRRVDWQIVTDVSKVRSSSPRTAWPWIWSCFRQHCATAHKTWIFGSITVLTVSIVISVRACTVTKVRELTVCSSTCPKRTAWMDEKHEIIVPRGRSLPLRFTWILPSSGLLCRVGELITDVSGLPICPVLFTWLLKMEQIGSPETSVLNQRTLCNNPEDGRIQVKVK